MIEPNEPKLPDGVEGRRDNDHMVYSGPGLPEFRVPVLTEGWDRLRACVAHAEFHMTAIQESLAWLRERAMTAEELEELLA